MDCYLARAYDGRLYNFQKLSYLYIQEKHEEIIMLRKNKKGKKNKYTAKRKKGEK